MLPCKNNHFAVNLACDPREKPCRVQGSPTAPKTNPTGTIVYCNRSTCWFFAGKDATGTSWSQAKASGIVTKHAVDHIVAPHQGQIRRGATPVVLNVRVCPHLQQVPGCPSQVASPHPLPDCSQAQDMEAFKAKSLVGRPPPRIRTAHPTTRHGSAAPRAAPRAVLLGSVHRHPCMMPQCQHTCPACRKPSCRTTRVMIHHPCL